MRVGGLGGKPKSSPKKIERRGSKLKSQGYTDLSLCSIYQGAIFSTCFEQTKKAPAPFHRNSLDVDRLACGFSQARQGEVLAALQRV